MEQKLVEEPAVDPRTNCSGLVLCQGILLVVLDSRAKEEDLGSGDSRIVNWRMAIERPGRAEFEFENVRWKLAEAGYRPGVELTAE